MSTRRNRLLLALLVGTGGGLGGLRAAAAEVPATVIAVQVRGTVVVQHDKATETEAVTEGAQLGAADTITTAVKSSVTLVLPSGSVVALKESSRLKIATALHLPLVGEALAANEAEPRETAASSQTGFELAFGEMLTRVRKLNPTSTFTVQTPVSVAAVRGTVFEVAFHPDTKGEASYRLSTSSGLVHVTPHAGKMIAVPANEQLDFAAEIRKKAVKIKHLKSSKLDRKKAEQIQAEAQDNERHAGEFMQRVQAAGAAAKLKAAAQATGNTPGSVTDRTKTGAGTTAGGTDRTSGHATPTAKPATPPGNVAPTPTPNRAPSPTPPTVKPTHPPVKPTVPPKPIKRPPRRT